MEIPQNGRFIWEDPIKIGDLVGVPPFMETSIHIYIYTYIYMYIYTQNYICMYVCIVLYCIVLKCIAKL